MEGAEFTENIINGVERPVKADELFAFTWRGRAGNTDVLTDAEENAPQTLRAAGVTSCRKGNSGLPPPRVGSCRWAGLKGSLQASPFGPAPAADVCSGACGRS